LICVALVCLCQCAEARKEQRQFSVDHKTFERPVSLPTPVANAILQDPDIQQFLKVANIPGDTLPPNWFLASEVKLSDSGPPSLIVMGTGVFVSRNLATFWVFRPTGDRWELVLNEPAHDLRITDALHRGFRNIELREANSDASWRDLFQFDGSAYQWFMTFSTNRDTADRHSLRLLDSARTGDEDATLEIDRLVRSAIERHVKPGEILRGYFPDFVKWGDDGAMTVVSVRLVGNTTRCVGYEVSTKPLKIIATLTEADLKQRYGVSCV
jgi:hypothetical protein